MLEILGPVLDIALDRGNMNLIRNQKYSKHIISVCKESNM